MKDRFLYRAQNSRWIVYDQDFPGRMNDHVPIASCTLEHEANTIVYFMNKGFKYDPTWHSKSIAEYEAKLLKVGE